MKISNGDLIRNIDKYSIEKLGIPSMILMENAALKIMKSIDMRNTRSFVIVCGRGNNGGDGLALARHLIAAEKKVNIFSIGLNDMSKDCGINHDILVNMGVRITNITSVEDIEYLRASIRRSDMVIDAIFGIGLKRGVTGIYEHAINVINGSAKKIISVDVPSGFQCDTGEVVGNCIRADRTVTFETFKSGFLKYGSSKYTGEIVVEKIGIPKYVVEKFHDKDFLVEEKFITDSMKDRVEYSHKGNFGHVGIIAGSYGMTGAALITTKAAVKTGAGLTTLISCKEVIEGVKCFAPEAMWREYTDETVDDVISKMNCVAIGPGLGQNEETLRWVEKLLGNEKITLVIDADGLNVLEDKVEVLKRAKCKVILTPHPGEMSRLIGMEISEIQKDRIKIAKDFAKEYGVVLLLKGYNTITTDGEIAYINSTGNGSMANGGMGDCLTGIIASLSAQGYDPIEAAYLGAYIHGKCGDIISQERFAVTATDIIESIASTIKRIINH